MGERSPLEEKKEVKRCPPGGRSLLSLLFDKVSRLHD
jgi:hypothetical protein